MEFQELEAFVELSKTKNFTRTAEQLHISQSTVTTRIRSLEHSLGKSLFNRDNRHVELTAVGRKFLPYVQRILDLIKEGEKATLVEGEFEDHLVLGSLHSLWDYVLYPFVDRFVENYSTISLRTVTGHSDEIARKMMDGIVDVGMVYLPPKASEIEVVPIVHNTLKLVAHPSFEVQDEPLSVKDLSNYPYVHMDWGDPFSDWYQSEVGEIRLHPLQVDHTTLLLQFILSGKYMGFLLDSVSDPFIEKGELKEINIKSNDPILERTTYLIYPKRKKQQPGVSRWIDFIQQTFVRM